LKPHALPEYLEGRTPKKNVLSIFKKNFTPAKSKKQETFFFGVAGVLASAWGFGSFVQFPLEKGSRKVYNYSTFEKIASFETPFPMRRRPNRAVFGAQTRAWRFPARGGQAVRGKNIFRHFVGE